MWGWGESQNNQENGSSELESRIDDQNQLINQLKEVIRENEAKLVEKEKLIEENKASYSKYKLQTKAKINQLTNQLSENKKQIRDCASPLRRDEEDDVSSEGSRGSYVTEQSSRAKLILLRKQLDDSRLLNEKQEKNLEDLNSRIENLEKLVLEKEESIEELKKKNSLIGQADGNVADVHEMYAQMVYKDNKIMELDNRIRQLEGSLMDVQETVKEKDQVIDARNRAIQLMTEDLSLRKKNVVDQLDDTRDEMRQMQFKFSTLETEWNEEKQSLLQTLETEKDEFKLKITDKDNKLIHFEESLKNMESVRFELSTRNAQLQEKVVLLQESLEKIKKNVSNDNTKELKLEIQAMKEQLNEKEAIINSLQLSEKENSSKQQKTPGESKSLVKIKAQYVSRIKNLEKQLEAVQKLADESQVHSQRIAELESANEELNAQLESQQKYLVEKDENLVKASDRQAKVKDLLENFCKSHGVIEPTAEAIEEGLSKVSLDKEKLKNYVENLCKRFSVASMDELDSVFDSLESKEAGLIKEIETYQSEMEKWKSEIERYKSDIENYKLYIETYKSDIETYKSDIETYKSDNESYKSDIETYISDVESYKAEIESYKTDKENSKIEMKKIQEKLIQVQGDLEQLKVSSKEEKDLLNEKIQKHDEEFNNIKLENDQLITDAQKKLQKIKKMEMELTEKDNKLKEANEMMENKIAVISGDRERELMEFQKRLSLAGNLEQKHEHVTEVMNGKMKEMETNIFNLTSQLAEKEKEINELQQKSELHLKEIEDLNSKWKDEVEYYQKEIEERNLNVQQLELSVKCKLDSSSEINSKLQEDLKCTQDLLGVEKLHCQELKEGIEQAEKMLGLAEKELEEQVEKMSILQNKLKDEEEIKRNELAKMREMFDSNKLEFERRLENFHQEEADFMKLKSELEEKLSEKVFLINELHEKCSQLEKKIEFESAEKCQAVEECEKIAKDFELFKVYTEEGLKALQDDNEKLTELRDSKQEQEELLKEIEEKYKSEIENLLSELEIQNNLKLKEKEELKIVCDKSTEKNNKLAAYIIELENDLSNLAESRDKTIEEKQSLDAQLMELKTCLEEGQRSLIIQQEEFNKKIELLTAENKEELQISVGKLKLLEEEKKELIQNVKRSEELTINTTKEKEEVNEILENLKREKESLIEIMKQGDMDLNNLRKEKELMEKYYEKKDKIINQLKNLNIKNEEKISGLLESIERLNLEKEQAVSSTLSAEESFNVAYNEMKEKFEMAKNELKMVQNDSIEKNNQLEKLNNELKEIHEKNLNLEKLLHDKLMEIEVMERNRQSQQESLEEVQKEFQEVRQRYEDLNNKIDHEIDDSNMRNLELESTIDKLQELIQEKNSENKELIKLKSSTQENYEQCKIELENQLQIKAAELVELRNELEKRISELKCLSVNYEDLQFKLSSSLEEVNKVNEEKSAFKTELEVVINSYEEKLRDIQLDIQEKEKQREEIAKSSHQSLETQVQTLNDHANELIKQKTLLESELSVSNENYSKIKNDFEANAFKLREVTERCMEFENQIESYIQYKSELENKLELITKKCAEYEAIISNKESEIEKLHNECKELNSSHEDLKLRFSLSLEEISTLIHDKDEISKQLEMVTMKYEDIKTDSEENVINIHERNSELESILALNEKKLLEIQEELNARNVEIEKLQNDCEAKSKLEAELMIVIEERIKLSEDIDKLNEDFRIVQRQCEEKLKEEVKYRQRAEEMSENLKQENEKLLDYLNRKESEIKQLQIADAENLMQKEQQIEQLSLRNIELEVSVAQLQQIIEEKKLENEQLIKLKNDTQKAELDKETVTRKDEIVNAVHKLEWDWSDEWNSENVHKPVVSLIGEASNETLLEENMKLKNENEDLKQQLKEIIAQHEKMSKKFVPDLGIEGDKKCDEDTLSKEEEVVNALHRLEEGFDDIHRPVIPIINETNDETLLEENIRLKNEIEALKQQLKEIIAQHEKMSQRFVPDLYDKDISSGEDIKPAEHKLEWEWSEEWKIDNIHRPETTETSNETLTEENLKLKSEIENLQQQLKTIIAQHEKISQRFVPDLGIKGDKKCDEGTLSREEVIINAVHSLEEGLDDIHVPVIPMINETTDETFLEENIKLKSEIVQLRQQLKEIIAQNEKMSQRFVPDLGSEEVKCDEGNLSREEDTKTALNRFEWDWTDEWGIDNIHKPNTEIGNETMFDVNAKLKNEIEDLKQQLKEMIFQNEKVSQKFVPDLGTEEKIKCDKETSSREEEIVNAIQILEQEVDDFHRPEIPVINETAVETLLEENIRLKNEIEALKQQLKEIIAQHEKMSQRFVPDLYDKDTSSGEDIKTAVHKLEWEWSEEWGINNIHRPATTETSNETLTEENLKLKSEIEDLKQQLREIIAKNENMTERFVPDLGSGKDPKGENSNSVMVQISEDSGWEDNSNNETLVEENRKLRLEIEELRTQLRQLISEHEVMTKTHRMDLGFEDLSEKNTQLLQDLAESQNQVDSHLREMEVLRNSAKELSDEKNKLVGELDKLREENETVMSDFNELNKLYQQEKDEQEKLKSSIDQKMNVNIENERLVSSSSEVDELKVVKIKNSKMLVKLKQFKEKSDKQQTEITQLNDKLTSLNEKVDMLEVSNGNLVEIKDQLENKVEELSLKINNLSQEKMNVEKQMKLLNDEQVLKLKDFMQEKTTLNNQLKKLSEEKERLQRETIASKEQTEILMSDNNTFQTIVENLNQAKVRMDEEMRQYATQVYHLVEDKEKLQHQVDNFNDLKIKYEEIQQNQKKTEIRCRELQEELNELQEKCENYQVQNEGLRRDKVELELKLAQTSGDDKLEMEEIFKIAEKDKVELEGRVLELTRIVKEIGTERDEIADKLHISGQIVNEKEMEIESIQNGASNLKLELEQLQTKLQIANTNNEESKLLIEEFTQRNNALVEEIDRISSTESDLLQRMSVMEKEFEHLQTEHQNLNQIFNESKINDSETNLLKDKIDHLEMELNQSVHLLHERGYQCNHLTQDIAQLIDEKSNLQMNLSSLTKNSHQLEIKIDELENLLEEERKAHTPKQPQSSDLLLNIEENQPLIIPETNFTLTRTMRGTAWRIQNWMQGRSMCGNPILHL